MPKTFLLAVCSPGAGGIRRTRPIKKSRHVDVPIHLYRLRSVSLFHPLSSSRHDLEVTVQYRRLDTGWWSRNWDHRPRNKAGTGSERSGEIQNCLSTCVCYGAWPVCRELRVYEEPLTGRLRLAHRLGLRLVHRLGLRLVHRLGLRLVHRLGLRLVHRLSLRLVHRLGLRLVHRLGLRLVHRLGLRLVHRLGLRLVHRLGLRLVHRLGLRLVHRLGLRLVHRPIC